MGEEINMGMTDSNLGNTFVSCRTGNILQPNMWLKNEPNNTSRNKACTVFTVVAPKIYGFSNVKCDVERPFACQTQHMDKIIEINRNKNNKNDKGTTTTDVQTTTKSTVELTVAVTLAPTITSTFSTAMQTNVKTIMPTNYSSQTSQFMITSRLYKCELFACTEKVDSLYALGDSAKVPETAGVLVKKCGAKKYLFTNKKIAFMDTWKECCFYGMIPASIESKDDLKCLHQNYFIMQKGRQDVSTLFFTAQMDAYLERRFVSCASANFVPQDLWWKNEPDNKESREACVALKFDNFTAGLVDSRCGEYTNVVCEISSIFVKYSSSRILVTTTTMKPMIKTTTTQRKTTTILSKYSSTSSVISSVKPSASSLKTTTKSVQSTTIINAKVSYFVPFKIITTSTPRTTTHAVTTTKIL